MEERGRWWSMVGRLGDRHASEWGYLGFGYCNYLMDSIPLDLLLRSESSSLGDLALGEGDETGYLEMQIYTMPNALTQPLWLYHQRSVL